MYLTEQKQCTKCKRYFNLTNFHIRNKKNNKLHNWCKQCFNLDARERYYKDVKPFRPKPIATGKLSKWLRGVICHSKSRAKLKNIEHSITKEWILDNLPKVCPVLGIELSFEDTRDNSPSLDRFDNNKGYTTDNVRIISFRANVLKNNATLEELEAIVRYMKNE